MLVLGCQLNHCIQHDCKVYKERKDLNNRSHSEKSLMDDRMATLGKPREPAWLGKQGQDPRAGPKAPQLHTLALQCFWLDSSVCEMRPLGFLPALSNLPSEHRSVPAPAPPSRGRMCLLLLPCTHLLLPSHCPSCKGSTCVL